eukprot:CAMPEP_0176469836 /NCGR_PEP_ID=MMETSP0127-20121128/40097_1 /TAXON_ID=938130 /ORGANISM="Platyophrya macrostoma, Strain WH" /LENGTH=50 /DNA_ID=CAMNT_0017864015 /DNA_START=1 /DNA_END=153 /DNA_ORIENTATION=+
MLTTCVLPPNEGPSTTMSSAPRHRRTSIATISNRSPTCDAHWTRQNAEQN